MGGDVSVMGSETPALSRTADKRLFLTREKKKDRRGAERLIRIRPTSAG